MPIERMAAEVPATLKQCDLHFEAKKLVCATCDNSLVCFLCTTHGAHVGHTTKLIPEAAAAQRASIDAKLHDGQAKLRDVATRNLEAHTSEVELLKHQEEVVGEIRREVEKAREALDRKEQELIEKVFNHVNERLVEIRKDLFASASCLAKAHATHHTVVHQRRLGLDDLSLMASSVAMETRLQEVLEESAAQLKNVRVDTGRIDFKVKSDLFAAIESMDIQLKGIARKGRGPMGPPAQVCLLFGFVSQLVILLLSFFYKFTTFIILLFYYFILLFYCHIIYLIFLLFIIFIISLFNLFNILIFCYCILLFCLLI